MSTPLGPAGDAGTPPAGRQVLVERTESHVQCECPAALCKHQPDGYRVVVEWGAWDERGSFLGTFDTKRAAMEATRG